MTYKKGSRGEMVKKIQQALGRAGLKVIADGIYGRNTECAVKEFQTVNGLKEDGICGAATLAKLSLGYLMPKTGRVITEIIVHCTATEEGKPFTVEDIRRWHKQQGWADIGYHYVVYLDGSVHEGRSVDLIGAHCEINGHNTHSIGVVYIGGLSSDGKPKDTRTAEQKKSLIELLKKLKTEYPSARIYGHRDFDKKDCPCFNAKLEYGRI